MESWAASSYSVDSESDVELADLYETFYESAASSYSVDSESDVELADQPSTSHFARPRLLMEHLTTAWITRPAKKSRRQLHPHCMKEHV